MMRRAVGGMGLFLVLVVFAGRQPGRCDREGPRGSTRTSFLEPGTGKS